MDNLACLLLGIAQPEGSSLSAVRLALARLPCLPAWLAADTLIEQASGKKVSEIFAEEGEAEFREVETQVLAVSERTECGRA